MPVSFAVLEPALVDGILNIVGLGTKKQMAWINAVWDITFVANNQPLRDWAVVEFPAKSMHQHCPIRVIHLSVTRGHGVAGPKPASISLFDHAPESFFGATQAIEPVAILGAEETTPAVVVTDAYTKMRPALMTLDEVTGDRSVSLAGRRVCNSGPTDGYRFDMELGFAHVFLPMKKSFDRFQVHVSSKHLSQSKDKISIYQVCLGDKYVLARQV